MKTRNDAIGEAIDLLSTHSFVALGECSASMLVKCKGPTTFAKLYIDKLKDLRGDGNYEAGMHAVIGVLEGFRLERKPAPHLVETDHPEQYMSLYVSRLQSLLNGGA